MNYNKIRKMDISNGSGVRVSIFVQGCMFHCKGCFNPETWNFEGGKRFTQETLNKLLDLCKKSYIKGLSILGGEPLHDKNCDEILNIIKTFKRELPDKDIWVWTGYTYENILKENNKTKLNIIKEINVLIDGQFKQEEKDLTLKYSGSKNQRVIDVKKTIAQNQIVLYE